MQANPVTPGRYDDDTIVQSSIDPTKRVGPTSPVACASLRTTKCKLAWGWRSHPPLMPLLIKTT